MFFPTFLFFIYFIINFKLFIVNYFLTVPKEYKILFTLPNIYFTDIVFASIKVLNYFSYYLKLSSKQK